MPAKKSSQRVMATKSRPVSRRGSKPQVERKRRARINHSLAELQALVINTNHDKQGSRIEKADILEMTVQYLKTIQKGGDKQNCEASKVQEVSTPANECDPIRRFNCGYVECANNVSRYLKEIEKVDITFHDRVKLHLMTLLQDLNVAKSGAAIEEEKIKVKEVGSTAEIENKNSPSTPSHFGFTPENNDKLVQVIPGRLANGQLAFLLPHDSLDNFFKLDEQYCVNDLQHLTPIPTHQMEANKDVESQYYFGSGSHHRFLSSSSEFMMGNSNYDFMWRPW